MIQQIYRHLAAQFKLPMQDVNQAGTSIAADAERNPSASQIVWTFDKHVIIRCNPQFVAQFEALIQAGQALSIADIADNLDVTVLEQDNYYSITKEDFIAHESDYTVRQLTAGDAAAFDAFQANCSQQDREYAEIGLHDEAIFGALDGERIIATASTFEWYGFVDFGVLTDPDYRGQGLGKAVVAAIVKHYLEHEEQRLLLYKHESSNIGSGKIAKAVGWQQFATVDFLRFKETES